VLDLGCSDGKKIIRWAQLPVFKNWEFEGVYSTKQGAKHGQPPKNLPENVSFTDSDAREYLKSKPDNHYTLITSDMYLGWAYPHTARDNDENYRLVWEQAYRTLEPGGSFKLIISGGMLDWAEKLFQESGFEEITNRPLNPREQRKTTWVVNTTGKLIQASGTKPKTK